MGAITDKIKGKAMKAEGRVTGDRIRSAEGSAVEGRGKIKGAVKRAGDKVARGARKVARKVKRATR